MEPRPDLAMRIVDCVRDAGQKVKQTVTRTTTAVQQVVPICLATSRYAPQSNRTIQEIHALHRSLPSTHEQRRLDAIFVSKTPSEVEAAVQQAGVYWHGDPVSLMPPSSGSVDMVDAVRAAFRRW